MRATSPSPSLSPSSSGRAPHEGLTHDELMRLKPMLDRAAADLETEEYIADDPVQFIHKFHDAWDRDIAGFLAAMMAWGRRDIVISKTGELLERMGSSPSRFVEDYAAVRGRHPGGSGRHRGIRRFEDFRHRTFNATDIDALLQGLSAMMRSHESMDAFWGMCLERAEGDPSHLMAAFRRAFHELSPGMPQRIRRHLPLDDSNTPSKRLWMLLRWMVRKGSPADPGDWTFMRPRDLRIPLDVHVARQSRRLGLLVRRSNDRLAVEQLTSVLRRLDPDDPVRYDYALFGIGLGMPH